MNKLAFWKQKLVQAFHDPPGKPYVFYAGQGGHEKLARRCFKSFTAKPLKYYKLRPDRAATGADRPVMNFPRGTNGNLGNIAYYKPGNNVITHPLVGGYTLQLSGEAGAEPQREDIPELIDAQERTAEDLADQLDGVDWGDEAALESGFRVLWRRYRDELAHWDGAVHPSSLWERMPGDSRVPDHSIWEHLKVCSALAFLDKDLGKNVPEAQEPYLFTFSLNPVQTFIEESRKSRDLWVSSFLLADLAWHAMLPIVEHYGPDCVMYPDLRGNPRVDNWLHHEYPEALREGHEYPRTHAAVLPHTFVAILPRGGGGHLLPLAEVAQRCGERLQKRWSDLATQVRNDLEQKTQTTSWIKIWERQHAQVINGYWTAVHWQAPQQVKDLEQFVRGTSGRGLLAQDPHHLEPASDETREKMAARAARLEPWMSRETWAHYERTRAVFGRVNLCYLQGERGFDYALTHHELRVHQRARKQEAYPFGSEAEAGEKCTMCRRREALHDAGDASSDTIDQRRQRVRKFWEHLGRDEDEPGAERLCAVCAFKRYLIDAGNETGGVNALWRAPGDPTEGAKHKTKVPFPSTSAVACQKFLASVATSQDPEVRDAVQEVVDAHQATELKPTLYPSTLARLHDASRHSSLARRFLELEPQETVFPNALQSTIARQTIARQEPSRHREGRSHSAEQGSMLARSEDLKQLQRAAKNLVKVASKAKIEAPDTHFAVVMMDGDNMGKLLLGDPGTIRAHWRDVLHPVVLERMGFEKTAAPPGSSAMPSAATEETTPFQEAGWGTILDAPRLMGPSLHAFISRTLAEFSHRIVPWVVEQEFGGRLVYAGGDDVLALVPAREALPMAARLQQLFSAPWILDNRHDIEAWAWRRPGTSVEFKPDEARWRFLIPKAATSGQRDAQAIQFPLARDQVVPPVGENGEARGPSGPFEGQLLAGLGRHYSLSASIVCGHYKTVLSTLLRRGRLLLEERAKAHPGKAAVALAHHSRGGLKSEFVLPWKGSGESSVVSTVGSLSFEAHLLVEQVVNAFAAGAAQEGAVRGPALPHRLPYKLREVARFLTLEPEGIERRKLAHRLLEQALDGELKSNGELESDDKRDGTENQALKLKHAVVELWLRGFDEHERRANQAGAEQEQARTELPERSVEGLLFCRYLASRGEEEEDE